MQHRAPATCFVLLSSVFVARWAVSAGDELNLTLAPAKTQVGFTLGDVLHTVHGTFEVKRGQITVDPASGAMSGEIVVDAASGNTGGAMRDRRMTRSILEAQRYPEIVFAPSKMSGQMPGAASARVEVRGLFKIHGAAHEITIPVDVQPSGDEWIATGKFVVPYVKWGMKNPSTLFLRVNDKVDIDIKATMQRARAATP